MDLINRGTSLLLPKKFGYLSSKTFLSYKGIRQKKKKGGGCLKKDIYIESDSLTTQDI